MASKLFLIQLILAFSVAFSSCAKKKYNCVCSGHIIYFVGASPQIRKEEYYNTDQIIDKKLTKEQATSSCKLVEKAFRDGMYPLPYYGFIQTLESSCSIK